ncbi:hypothetical protein B0T18DRAFT_227398 [Schizothecium vesticola]|uniref:Uncharacterized protein n=1 Tax=Schizothecium vesticola TaxID=314040 RepID=A0AA40EKY6_9PEZI|nr:hypothetical protein B0T18DRAFT_227398 [Schizothecium vesticola]
MQDSGRAPGAPQWTFTMRPPPSPSSIHSPESQKQPASSQSGFIAACPPAPESPIPLRSPPRGRGRQRLRLLLRKRVKARGLITSIPGGQEGRQARHGRLWLFGSGRHLAPIRTTASQSATPEDQRLAPPAKTSTRPAEGGAGRKGGFDRMVRARDGIHHVKCLLANLSDSVAAGHPNTVVLGYQRVTRCVTAPSRVVPLPSSKGGRKVRLGRLPSRKPVTAGLTAIVASNDNGSATPRPRQWLSDLPFLPRQQSDCACVAPWWRSLNHETLPIGFVTPTTAPDVMGANDPETTPRPLFVLLATLESGFAARPSRWIWLGWPKQAACLSMQGAAHHARYLCRHRVQKRGQLVSFGPVNEGGAPASRGGQQESSHHVPRLPRSFGTASSIMESTRAPRGLRATVAQGCRVGRRPI